MSDAPVFPSLFPIYTVYKDPKDYPGKYVLRRWMGMEADDEPTAVSDSLDEVRDALPRGLHCLHRQPDDDPTIKEVWL